MTNTDCFNAALNKPKLLIIGHARHGKDTFGELLVKKMHLSFVSSSEFVGRKCIWPIWGKERYSSFSDMFDDRANFRETWFNLITAYNTPDLARTGREMMAEHDIYVGMRNPDEFHACQKEKLFDKVIWVDGSSRHPLENKNSNKMTADLADIWIDNNGPEESLHVAVSNLQLMLHKNGFDVNYTSTEKLDPKYTEVPDVSLRADENHEKPQTDEKKEETPEKSWKDAPDGATQVLDHGFFKVIEVMGSDTTICESARMSYGRGTKKTSSLKKLISYLVRNGHTSPLEMGEIRFHIRMPIFVMRQWVRHRTANLNEYSGRYSEMVRLWYVPELEQICVQDKVNKQGSAEPMDKADAEDAQRLIWETCNMSFNAYEELLAEDVSRETARIVLPLNTYTEVVWKLDISNLIKFLKLRDDDHAQWEIRQYAKLVAEAVKEHFPLVYDAYLETRQSQSFTMDEIRTLITGDPDNLSVTQKRRLVLLRYNILN